MIDFRSFGPVGTRAPEGQDREWWKLSGKPLADAVSTTLSVMDRAQQTRVTQLLQSARLYGNLPSGMRAMTPQRDRLAFNVVQSAVDTITSKLAKNKPKPLFLTSGGNHKEQRKAKKLNKFIEGLFYELRAYDLGSRAFRSGCIDGDGLIHVFAKNGRVAWERVPVAEIFVDEFEALYGMPRQMHREVNVDRRVLIAALGKKKIIEEANAPEQPATGTPNIADSVRVRESWHLPSGPDAGDGLHCITLAGEVLLEEEWEHEWFPFARFQWCPREYGYWSQGLAEQLMPIQIEINKLLWAVQEGYRLAAMNVIFVENGSKVVKAHLTNVPGTVVQYSGATAPQYATPGILPPEVYSHLERLKASAYEQAGISQLSAASVKPAGLDSGKALREYNDIESDRFMTVGHAYENFYLDLARLSIATARDIAEEEGGYKVKVPGRFAHVEIDWKDIDLDEDSYVMQCFPVSSLPNEPAGRFQTIQEWVQAGWYTARQGKKLMNFPDLEAVDSLEQAAEDWLAKVLDDIVDEGDYTPPEPFDNLDLGYEMALEYYQQGKLCQLEEGRLELLRRFMIQIDGYREAAAAKMAADSQQAANSDPQAVPQAPPVSDILPNAPQAAA